MPRGNVENFKGKGFDSRTTEERVEIARRGGLASGESRKKKKMIRDYLEALLEKDAGRNEKGEKISAAEFMATSAVKAAMNGDWKAWELVRDTAGQKPVERVMLTEVEQEVIDEVERIALE